MRRHVWIGAFLIAVIAGGRATSGEQPRCDVGQGGWLQRWHPAGGWNPYGGGLLHWWDPHCFPRGGFPDDYCRKPLPHVCWPPYPSYYTWGPPEIGYPQRNGPRDCNQPNCEP